MLQLKKNILVKYLISLLPFSLVLSIFATELILIFISLLYIYETYNKNFTKLFFYNYSLFGFFLVIFFFYVSLNSFFIESEFFIRNTLFYFRFYFYFISILFFLNKLNIYNFILKSFFIVFFILILDAIFQFIFGFNIIGMPIVVANRISSFFGDELIMGSFLVRLMPFFLIFLYVSNMHIYLKIIFLFSLILAIILSGERVALFLFLFGAFIVFLLSKKLRYYAVLFVTFTIVSLIVLVNFNKTFYERYYYNFFNSLNIVKTHDGGIIKSFDFIDSNKKIKVKLFSDHHQTHYESAYKIFINNFLIGGGTKSFRYLCQKNEYIVSKSSCSTHPHNIIMQFLSELGMLGFLFLLIFHLLIIKDFTKISKIKNSEKDKHVLIFALIGLVINFFPFIPSGNFFNNWLSIIFLLNLSNYIYQRQKYF